MFKAASNFLAVLAVVALSMISTVTTASAVVPFSQPTSISTSMNLVTVIPKNDESSVLIWRDGSGSTNVLRSSVLHLDGSVTDTSLIFSPAENERYSVAQQNAWTRLSDGSFAITWTTFNDMTLDSKLHVAYSDNGTDWSAPVMVGGPYGAQQGADCMFGCGYREAQIASDGLGRLAIQSTVGSSYHEQTFQVQESTDGRTWSQPTQFGVVSDYIFASTIIGQPTGGFINSWVASSQGSSTRYVSRTAGSFVMAWVSPKAISSVYQVNTGATLIQSGINEFSVVYVANYNEADRYAAVVSRFSTVTKTWSAEQQIMVTGAADYLTSDIAATVAADGTVGVVLMSGIDAQSSATLHFNTFKNGVIGAKSTPVVAGEVNTFFAGLNANKDNSFSAVYRGVNTGVKVANFGAGITTTTQTLPFVSGAFGETVSGASVNGNIFAVAVSGSQGQFIAVTQATAPSFTGTPGISGKAKKGAVLAAKAISFKGLAGFGPTSYQWFACSSAVPANTLSQPNNCVPIAKATAAKFKVTSKQKGKFVTVVVKSRNVIGETTVFAPSAVKTK